MTKKKEIKSRKNWVYYMVAVLLVAAVITGLCLASCEREPIIGYDPPTPQEWLDELEAEKNRTDTDFLRTYDLDGIWRDSATGKLYQVYMGHIFELNKLDAGIDDYYLLGTMVAVQNMEKTEAEHLSSSGGNERVSGDEYQIYYNIYGIDESEGTIKIVDAETIKTVTKSGKEFTYRFVEEKDGWPEGFRE